MLKIIGFSPYEKRQIYRRLYDKRCHPAILKSVNVTYRRIV